MYKLGTNRHKIIASKNTSKKSSFREKKIGTDSRKPEKKKVRMEKSMEQGRYKFSNIFSFYPDLGLIIPKFTVVINNKKYSKGQAINKTTSFGGLNLFNYVGRDIAGLWNRTTKELTILGFYT